MKRYSVLVGAPAASEIEAAYLYIREDSLLNATNWRLGLAEAAESLKTFPKRCGLAPENGPFEFEIRQLIYGNYRLLFTIRRGQHEVESCRAPAASVTRFYCAGFP